MSFLKKKLNGKILLSVVLVLIISGGITAYILLNNDNNKVEQKENNNEVQKNEQQAKVLLSGNLDYEINSELNLLSLISEDNKAEIISEDQTIDTSTLGKKELVIKYKDNGEEKEYKFEINVIDTTKPTIEYESELSTTQGTEIDLLKDVKVSDNSNEEIKATIEGTYNFDKEGTYNLKYVAVDSSNNKIEKEFVLKVNKKKTTSTNNSTSSNIQNTTTNTTKPSTNNNSTNTSNNSSKNETTTTTPTETPKVEETTTTITQEQINAKITELNNKYKLNGSIVSSYPSESLYESYIPAEYKNHIRLIMRYGDAWTEYWYENEVMKYEYKANLIRNDFNHGFQGWDQSADQRLWAVALDTNFQSCTTNSDGTKTCPQGKLKTTTYKFAIIVYKAK